MRRLYHNTRLVHRYLSKYNVLLFPVFLAEKYSLPDLLGGNLQVSLNKFNQTVEINLPKLIEMMQRDLAVVIFFVVWKGISHLVEKDTGKFVLNKVNNQQDFQGYLW